MSQAKNIGLLSVFILTVMGVTFATSEVRTVVVSGKFIEDVEMRRGRSAARYVLKTSEGDLPLLKFPLIGHAFDVEDVYDAVHAGDSIDVRIGHWPPQFLGGGGRRQIMTVY